MARETPPLVPPPESQEMTSNQSGAVGETIWGPFQGSLAHLGTSGRLQSQIQADFDLP